MSMRRSIVAVTLSCMVVISQAGCGGGGGSNPAAGGSVSGTSNGTSTTAAGSSGATGDSGAAGATAAAGATGATDPAGTGTSTGAAANGVAKLSWSAPPEGATGYTVSFGTASGSYSSTVDVGAAQSYTVSSLAAGTYYFAVRAYDSTGNKSSYSNEVSKVVN